MTDGARDLAQLQHEAQLASQQLAESWEEINLLYTIGEILGRTLHLDDAAQTILTEVSETVGASRAAIYVYDAASGLLTAVAALETAASAVPAIGIDDEVSAAARAFRTQLPVLLGEGEAVSPREAGIANGTMLSVPIMWTSPGGAVPLGVLSLSGRRAGQEFSGGERKLVAAIATQIGTAIQIDRLVKASMAQERLDHEMQLAHDLQMRLLPAPSAIAPEAQCAARVEPAQSVGGDFYHLFKLRDGQIGVLIGDVSSHGYQAALIMALTMSAMAIHAQAGNDPSATLGALLESLTDELRETEMFLTVCYVVIDPAKGELRYANAGHPHAFVVRADGTPQRLEALDPPLGLGSVAPRVAAREWKRSSDLLVLFTDGVSDARDADGRVLGEAAVLDVVRARRADVPTRIIDGVFAAVEGHLGATAPSDDQAIVVVRA